MVVVGSVRAVVESVLLPVVLWLITVGWTPVRGWRVVAVGSVRVVVGCVCLLIPVGLWLITLEWMPISGLRVIAVGLVRIVLR